MQISCWRYGTIMYDSVIMFHHKNLNKYCTVPFNNMRTQSSSEKCIFRYHQSNVQQLFPALNYFWALFRFLNCAQWYDYHALGSSQKLEGATKHLIEDSKKRILSVDRYLNCWVCMLLEGAVNSIDVYKIPAVFANCSHFSLYSESSRYYWQSVFSLCEF